MRKLNKGQLETLKLLYKFRFGSNKLIAQYFNKNRGEYVQNRLKILHDLGLINKHFDNSYRLKGKPAAYFLTPDGARAIQEHLDDPVNFKTIYSSKIVSEIFIEHCLSILEVFNNLRSQHGDALKFFTKVDLNLEKYDYFPKPLPDAFISITQSGDTKRFFLDVIEDSIPFFVLKRRVKQYLDYESSGEWAATGKELPTILFICESDKTEKKLQKYIEAALNQAWGDEIQFKTTTKQNLSLS